MRTLRDLLLLGETMLTPLVGVAFAVVLLLVVAMPGCACSTKETAYVTTMRAELRQAIDAQEQYRATHGAYARDLFDAYALPPSGLVTVSAYRPLPNGFALEVSMPARTRTRCRVRYDGTPPIALCGNRPPRALFSPPLPTPR